VGEEERRVSPAYAKASAGKESFNPKPDFYFFSYGKQSLEAVPFPRKGLFLFKCTRLYSLRTQDQIEKLGDLGEKKLFFCLGILFEYNDSVIAYP
jgi:hypothetical protein